MNKGIMHLLIGLFGFLAICAVAGSFAFWVTSDDDRPIVSTWEEVDVTVTDTYEITEVVEGVGDPEPLEIPEVFPSYVEPEEPEWTVDTHTGPFVDPGLRRARIAVDVLADNHSRARHYTLRHRQAIADIVVAAADSASVSRERYVDPIDLVIIWRFESGLRWQAVGDGGVSCGPTQIRTDFPGRPTCEELTDPQVALDWTADKLADIREDEGYLAVEQYNGAGRGAMRYAARHHAVRDLIEAAVAGGDFDVRMYDFVCDEFG